MMKHIEREAKAAALSLSLPRGLTWPTEQAREAVRGALLVDLDVPRVTTEDVDAVLAALAPHVAALVRAERAAALRDAAEAVPPGPHPNRCLAFSCVECARRYERDRLSDWLRDRADRIEADDART